MESVDPQPLIPCIGVISLLPAPKLLISPSIDMGLPIEMLLEDEFFATEGHESD